MGHKDFRLTAGGIGYDRVEGPVIDVTRDDERARETIRLRAADVLAFRREALPPPIFLLGLSGIAPHRRMPGAQWLITDSLSFRPESDDLPGDPFEADTGAPEGTYDEFYRCDISYRSWLEGDDNQRDQGDPTTFLEVDISAGGQFLSIPPRNSQVQEIDSLGRLPDGTEQGKATSMETNQSLQHGWLFTIPTVEYVLTWPLVLRPPFQLLEERMGTLNDAALPLFHNSPPGTVMFMGYSARQRFVWDGQRGRVQPWEIQYRFSKRAINRTSRDGKKRVFGWNHEFNDEKGDWVLMFAANNQPPFDETDFLQLFLPGV